MPSPHKSTNNSRATSSPMCPEADLEKSWDDHPRQALGWAAVNGKALGQKTALGVTLSPKCCD